MFWFHKNIGILLVAGKAKRLLSKNKNIEISPLFTAYPTILKKVARTLSSVKTPEKCTEVEMQSVSYEEFIDNNKNNKPVIILHGLLGSKENWNSLAKQLNRRIGRKVIAVDLRNHGSSPHTSSFSYDLMVADLKYFMDLNSFQKATIVGHSMGGRTAMMMAIKFPELVQSLVVVDISPKTSSSMMTNKQLLTDIGNLSLDRQLSFREARKEAGAQLRQMKYTDGVINFILLNLVEHAGDSKWRWRFNLKSILENYLNIQHFQAANTSCSTRTIFLGGTNSDYLTPDHEPVIKEIFSNVEFKYIQGAGHWIHADKPLEFLDIVVDFINKDSTKYQKCAESIPDHVDLAFQKYEDKIDNSKSSVPIVILHGLLGSKQNWNSMARQINVNVGRQVYSLDARNHGDSPHSEVFSYDSMVNDVVEFLQKHNITKVSLIGHSMGGRTSIKLAMKYPELVHSLVVVDISPGGPSANLLGIRQLLHDLHNLNVDPQLPVREARAQAAAQLRDSVKDEKLIAFLLTNLVENDGNAQKWQWKFNLDVIVRHFDSDIANFPVNKMDLNTRTLFIGGGESDYIKPTDEINIKKIFPLAEFVYIQGAGHWVHAEKPQEFLKTVSDFLNKDLK
ncbi:uncharacterized protein LOC128998742 [Macrosteles quadrilineatus]|uniref:uncharacterized protein LOC128998742 n=1 Tax=Macrosteles quadrilineatus TaxID=74068 RepID=UPI0023E0AF33|nr:uncharacterized protein LOC128998742 [Macrosteles quadrilineatus]